MTEPALWWQKGSIYQVYLRSFKDGNADGIGDLRGLSERLDYLKWLGIDAVWLSPLYPSPMADFGYDVADYTDVDPIFGSLAELTAAIDAAHSRNLRVILDFVPNHTSDQHAWFKAARSSRSDPKRDFYIWHDGTPDKPPNNWLSAFGGSAWTWDEATSQYYYHAFLAQQPDLNWRNPAVREAMYDCMRFWLDRGVDGFRMDVLWHLIKDAAFRDNPPNPNYVPTDIPYNALLPTYSTDQPEVHDIVKEMRALLDRYPERVMIGEIYLPIGKLVTYYGSAHDGAHLPFNFQLITLPWDARQISAAISEYEGALPAGAWPNWVLGNHDQPRIASRVGMAQARVAALLLLTLRGTPTLYYGDEIGMQDAALLPEEIQDPQGLNVGVSRDPQRTPMQWSHQPNAGFSQSRPWLPLSVDYELRNVEAEREDSDSMLSLYRRLLELRRQHPALAIGSYRPMPADPDLIVYIREHGEERFLAVLNLGHRPQKLSLAETGGGEIVVASERGREGQRLAGWLRLTGDDGVLIRLDRPK
jgi:alpha-glucosidase